MTLAAAADPCATLAGISFGPTAQPATRIPSVMVVTGSSLTCRSMKNPSTLQEMPNILATSLASSCGSRPVERITISTGMRHCLPTRVSSAWTISLFSSSGDPGNIRNFRYSSADEPDTFFQVAGVELIIALTGRTHINVELIHICAQIVRVRHVQTSSFACSR